MMLYLLREWGHNPRLAEGKRSAERQAQLYREGKSKTLKSKHLTGDAWDIVDELLQWAASQDFWRAVGRVARITGCVWGGQWCGFRDPAHTQWENGKIVG
jgi:peptidoglycan L-alanyl-D-glutamate endopeptidase CwlK